MVVFLVVSTVLLIFTKPFVAKFTAKGGAKTNADRLIGQSARLIEAVNNDLSQGALKLGGTTWSVKSITGESLPAGTRVVIEKIEGVTLYVRKEDECNVLFTSFLFLSILFHSFFYNLKLESSV